MSYQGRSCVDKSVWVFYLSICVISRQELCSYMSLSVLFVSLCHIKAGVVQLYEFEFSIYRFVSYQGRSCVVKSVWVFYVSLCVISRQELCSYMSLSFLCIVLCHIKAVVVQLYEFEFICLVESHQCTRLLPCT